MIEGVETRKLERITDERGWLIELLRSDWDLYERFGQAYITAAYPQVVKAWHMHKKQTDNIICIRGMVKFVLYDGRDQSSTYRNVCEYVLGDRKLMLIKIPALIWHGFQTISEETAIVLNLPTRLYNYKTPDEHRLPPDTNKIPYVWKLQPWLKHG